MKLKPLSLFDVEQARQWRNEQLEMLRTSFPLTKEMQEQFYHNVISNRQANARFWGLWEEKKEAEIYNAIDNLIFKDDNKQIYLYEPIGMVGIENIQWENKLGEISLLLNPEYNNQENLEQALKLILDQGFNYLNLENIYTEVYKCNNIYDFWIDIKRRIDVDVAILPNRKYFNGLYHDSIYINFNKERYNESIISKST